MIKETRFEACRQRTGAASQALTSITILTLQKPASMTGAAAWFENFYVPGSQADHDRKLFSH
jgi:hypothetical protein